ncbi:unnamed protein product, partial [Onchocerca ochengi]|uniref:ATP-dependent DNA helicase n=1 Tax=Onchocerca ochengi TaxID=42157 RepID=A0A182EU91_ONCOC
MILNVSSISIPPVIVTSAQDEDIEVDEICDEIFDDTVLIPVEMLINVEEIEMEENKVPEKRREITYTEEVDLQQSAEEVLKFSRSNHIQVHRVESDEAIKYSTIFTNSLDLSRMPPYVLQLKIGMPIIMLPNINPRKLCNYRRLA